MMLSFIHTKLVKHSRKLVVAALLMGVAGLAIASMGGEKRAKKSTAPIAAFTPIRTTSGFTLKAGPSYKGSFNLSQEKTPGGLNFNSLVTYQKGNTTYIMPVNHRINLGSTSPVDNTQMLRLKVRMHK